MLKSVSPVVSVIIPVYNTAGYLRSSVGSILSQTSADLEVICVDDGSTDDSAEVLRAMAAEDSRIKLLSEPNKGQGAARNYALSVATGRYVYFMDSDDILEPDTFSRCLDLCASDDLDLVLFDATTFYEEGQKESEGFSYDRSGRIDTDRVWSGPELLLHELQNMMFYVSPCLMFIRRDVLGSFPGFPEGIIHEDNVLAMHVMLNAARARYLPEKFFHRRVRGGSTMTIRYGLRNIRGYARACSMIEGWKNDANSSLIALFQRKTLESVIWLGSHMSVADKLETFRIMKKAGLAGYVSLKGWIRFALKRK